MGAPGGACYRRSRLASGSENAAGTLYRSSCENGAANEDWAGLFGGGPQRNELDPARKLLEGRYLLSAPYREGALSISTAVLGSQAIGAILSRLVWAADTVTELNRLPIPFVAVGTDLGTGEAVPLTRGPLSAAMRASMALPGVFMPVSYAGRRLIDGGVARNLPVRDVRALGADVAICVDVSGPLSAADRLTSAIGILMQVMAYRMQASTQAERTLCDARIEPVITGLSSSAFDQGTAWIARGVDAARVSMPAVRAILAARGVPLEDSVSRSPRAAFRRSGCRSPRLPCAAMPRCRQCRCRGPAWSRSVARASMQWRPSDWRAACSQPVAIRR